MWLETGPNLGEDSLVEGEDLKELKGHRSRALVTPMEHSPKRGLKRTMFLQDFPFSQTLEFS